MPFSTSYFDALSQGRLQDFSQGGARFLETKKLEKDFKLNSTLSFQEIIHYIT